MSNEIDRIRTTMEKVETATSSTTCLAKWHHTTIYLQTGETHSCYHPAPHKIPLDELKDNPSALHNTNHKKNERKEMLNGVQCEGCQYCWNIENMGDDYISDRHLKTTSLYTDSRLAEVVEGPWDQNVNPEYVEISFGNECNFKCGYCHPKASSRYYQEIKEHGPVTTVQNHRCDIDWFTLYEREEENPYVNAWWAWWPDLKKTLNILRITGGEPLMHKSTWKLFEELEKSPVSHLEVNINSNLGMSSRLVDKLSNKVNHAIANRHTKKFRLFTSIDTWGARAEYIRTGLDLDLWENNLNRFIVSTKSPVSIMITFNVLCVTSFTSLLEKILEWRRKYNVYDDMEDTQMIRFDTPYLKEPLQYDINILPKGEFMPFMYEALQFMRDNVVEGDKTKFSEVEYEKFRRVVDYMANTNYSNNKVDEGQRDFVNWFIAMDVRRGTNFLETFPEMKPFYDSITEKNVVERIPINVKRS